jgi:hypothetical protein
MPYSNPPTIAVFLTPGLAKTAYEQIAAWAQKEEGMKEIPAVVKTDSLRLKFVLSCVGVNFDLLKSAGVADVKNKRETGCGMTGYTREYQETVIDMKALYKLAQEKTPAPKGCKPRLRFPGR